MFSRATTFLALATGFTAFVNAQSPINPGRYYIHVVSDEANGLTCATKSNLITTKGDCPRGVLKWEVDTRFNQAYTMELLADDKTPSNGPNAVYAGYGDDSEAVILVDRPPIPELPPHWEIEAADPEEWGDDHYTIKEPGSNLVWTATGGQDNNVELRPLDDESEDQIWWFIRSSESED